jgi:hypothetical protein
MESNAMPFFDSSDTRVRTRVADRFTRRRFPLGGVRPADLFDAWMFAEADATFALGAWRSAAPADKPAAHTAYVAALDREAHAAHVFGQRARGRL